MYVAAYCTAERALFARNGQETLKLETETLTSRDRDRDRDETFKFRGETFVALET